MQVDGGECNSAQVSSHSRPYYYRRCKEKKSLTNIESLPDELLFEILVRLPDEDVYNCATLICWKWYDMIRSRDFIHAHVQHSAPGLLIRSYGRSGTVLVAIRKRRIEVSKFGHEIRGFDCWTSCNGLILEYRLSERPFQITNPVTKQQFAVPPFTWEEAKHHWCSMAYSAASKQYKVVHTCDPVVEDADLRCDILTVGVDNSWRRVPTQHLSPASKNLLHENPVMTEGFIHWTKAYSHVQVLTLNVRTETITEHPVPRQGYNRISRHYLSTGKSLSMFVRCGELSLEGWDMKSETGEWTKMYNIDLKPQKCKFEHVLGKDRYLAILVPTGWLKYREVLVLYFLNFPHPAWDYIAYNVRTQEIDLFQLDSHIKTQETNFPTLVDKNINPRGWDYDSSSHVFKGHTSSLAWLT